MDPLGPDPLIRSFERHLYAENRSARTVTTCLIASGRPTARLWSSRPTTELNPGIAVAGIYLYEAGKFRGYAYFYPDGTPTRARGHRRRQRRHLRALQPVAVRGRPALLREERPSTSTSSVPRTPGS
jgi:hypothetical protein